MGISKASRQRFLKYLAASGSVSLAAEAAEVARSSLYHLREHDSCFAAAWTEAVEIATDALEAEARRRAIEGVETPVIYGGRMVRDDAGNPLSVRRYSDSLLALLLRAHRPEKYRERSALAFDDAAGGNAAFTIRIGDKSCDGGRRRGESDEPEND